MVTAEGTFPKSDGDTIYASEYNKFNAGLWSDLIMLDAPNPINAILAHSATSWTAVNLTNTQITSDSGVTWTAASADNADMTGVSKVCIADKTKAISCDHDSGNISITSDSGDNWASATTDPAAITRVWDASFPTATVAVVGCDLGAASRSIFYSTDGGDNWTICVAGSTGDTFAIDMLDGTNGLAIDSGANIWTTSNGGVNWADSGQNVTTVLSNSNMVALTSTTGVILHESATTIETFNTTSGGTVRLKIMDAGEVQNHFSNIIKVTNGNLYFIQYVFSDAGDRSLNMTLFRSTDNGVTWAQKGLGNCLFEADSEFANYTKSQLIEYDTNKLLFIVGTKQLMSIDEN